MSTTVHHLGREKRRKCLIWGPDFPCLVDRSRHTRETVLSAADGIYGYIETNPPSADRHSQLVERERERPADRRQTGRPTDRTAGCNVYPRTTPPTHHLKHVQSDAPCGGDITALLHTFCRFGLVWITPSLHGHSQFHVDCFGLCMAVSCLSMCALYILSLIYVMQSMAMVVLVAMLESE